LGENKLKSKIWIVLITLLVSVINMNINIQANESTYKIKRVPAEWEPQEAIWMQWPGYWEKDYELTFAKITNIISRYEKLHIYTLQIKFIQKHKNQLEI